MSPTPGAPRGAPATSTPVVQHPKQTPHVSCDDTDKETPLTNRQTTRPTTRRRSLTSVALSGVVATMVGLATLATSAATAGASTSAVTVPAPASGAATVTETGSSLLYPLWNLWGPAYSAKYPSITISTASTGSGTGISSALAGTVDIGASDAYLSPAELSSNKNAMNIPLAISSQLVAYNLPSVTKPIKLSGPVLSQIYRGKITKWNASAIKALNRGVTLPSTPIVTLHRADSSGDTFLFTSYLSKSDETWGRTVEYGTTVNWPTIPGALAETGNSGMLQGCSATPGCIAYIGISYLSKVKAANLGYAALKNKTGKYLQPTSATVAAAAAGFANHTPANGVISMIDGPAANGYPIVNYEYAIVLKSQSSTATAQDIRSVLTWAIAPNGGNGSTFLAPVYFQPLPSKVRTQSLAQIKKIK